jgi:hypothetical protein
MEVTTMTRTCKSSAKCILTAMVCAFALSLAQPAFPGWLDGLKEIKVGDKTYPVCPEEEWTRAGFPPRQVPDEKNAAIEYINAVNLYVKEPEKLSDLYSYVRQNVWIDEAKALLPWLDQNGPAIAAVREGARKDDCRFPLLKAPGEPMMNLLLPHLSTMRALARLLVIQGKYLESQGKYRDALDNYLLIARMGYHVSKEPFLISGLVGVACDSIAARAIESCLLRNRLDAATLAYLRDRFDVLGSAASNYGIAISGERAFNLSCVDELFRCPELFREVLGQGGGQGPKMSVVVTRALTYAPGVRAMMKTDIRRYWDWKDEWNKLPDHVAFRPENQRADKIVDEMPAWSLGKMLLPALSKARLAFVRVRAVKAVLAAELALETYHAKNGAYPQNLDEVKGVFGQVPLDPFINEPVKYRRVEKGYIVYSVGENLTDDGGEGDMTGKQNDIVGRCPLPEPVPFKSSESQ